MVTVVDLLSIIFFCVWDINCAQIGMETLALKFVGDLTNLLASDPESLDMAYRTLLAGAYHLQAHLQMLCLNCACLEQEPKHDKSEQIQGQGQAQAQAQGQGQGQEHSQQFSHSVSQHIHNLQDELFAHPLSVEEITKLSQSTTHRRMDEIFGFIQFEVSIRIQYWMERSLQLTRDAIMRAAENEKWDPTESRSLHANDANLLSREKSFDVHDRGRASTYSDDDRATYAPFITDSFLFFDNAITAYFMNIKGFPPEAMHSSEQFFQQMRELVEYVLSIINGSFADVETIENETGPEENAKESLFGLGHAGKIKKKNTQKVFARHIWKHFSFTKHQDKSFHCDETEEGCVNRDVVIEMQVLEDEQFKKELKYTCVKFSSISRAQEIIPEMSGQLLKHIDSLEIPIEPVYRLYQRPCFFLCLKKKKKFLKERFSKCRETLKNACYKCVNDCKEIVQAAIPRAARSMACQFLDVQNSQFFSLKLYAPRRVPSTTIIKTGLLQKMVDYLNQCDQYLKVKDMRKLTCCLAGVFAQRMRDVLISPKTMRVFIFSDHTVITEDFEKVLQLFDEFNEIDFDRKRSPVDQPNHPFFPYYEIVKYMEIPTKSLVHQHNVIMAERYEEQSKRITPLLNAMPTTVLPSVLPLQTKNAPTTKTLPEEEKQTQEQSEVFSIAKIASELVSSQLSQQYITPWDHPIFSVLARRNEEEAQLYVTHFTGKDEAAVGSFYYA
ncbi:hypothetical protein RFI_11518 [Reticulomyxa filosa]|uniref:Uncharacterized protein n=1 Tax=Reticulomyxa filosa TaxID=46433 RepID=X6NHX8_RETFI|nr:hypothetical protein RFI_11518 [Reticulomyxa filosa]|eukprot:ETO25616.1 hypothetical protein RFI_11518 [Reticulomyxa filosa]